MRLMCCRTRDAGIKKHRLLNINGSALFIVIIALLVMSLFVTGVMAMTMGNQKHANYQEKMIRAHYIARSGAEIAYHVYVTSTLESDSKTGAGITRGPETIKIYDTDGVTEMGSAEVTVATTKDAATGNYEVEIKSTGHLINYEGMKKTLYLRYNADITPRELEWSEE